MRVTTLYAGKASVTARYYTRYLSAAPGEEPGVWCGSQADGLGLSGEVSTDALELLLSGCDPTTRETLGYPLKDRTLTNGRVVRAVAGFDATLSAPKSLSVWWALTGDDGLAACHDAAVRAVIRVVEQYGSTTRIRSNGRRLHPDSQGLTCAVFRQTMSRLDDPQLHTHVVVSSKVQTDDGRWLALDARVLKQYQRAFGGLYQSVLRAELAARYGVAFTEIVNGQAEIAGVSRPLIEAFSKRARDVRTALDVKLDEFWRRESRDPSPAERAAMEREAAADTRRHKTGFGNIDLREQWLAGAADLGITPASLTKSIAVAGRVAEPAPPVQLGEVLAAVSEQRSVWHRLDVLRALTDLARPQPGLDGEVWMGALDIAVDGAMGSIVDLDPTVDGPRRRSDGRSLWIEPVAPRATSRQVIEQEEAIIAWTLDTQLEPARPSATIESAGLDVRQADAAAAVAGRDPLTVVVGPAGAGKTTMLAAAVDDLHAHGRAAFGVAPTAKAARVLERETGLRSDTLAKLLHEHRRPEGPGPEFALTAGATIVVDEAGMIHTGDLHHLIHLAQTDRWRLALIGDPRQLQAVGRGGMFAEICTTPRSVELDTIHRFTNDWEAAASLQLRDGNPASLDTYEAHDRIRPGHLDEHLTTIADTWIERHRAGETLAITTTRNEHVDAINRRIQDRRADHREIDSTRNTLIADRQVACVGDVIATRRNRRDLTAGDGQPVRNRDLWTITTIGDDGHITATRHGTTSAVELPADYVREHVRLGYAASEPGNQSASITLATAATTSRGLYVALTRGRDENLVLVVTETHDVIEARDTLEMILTSDRSDTPAVAHRRALTTEASTWPARTECPPCPAMAAPTPEMAPLAACLPLNAELRNRRWPRGPMRC